MLEHSTTVRAETVDKAIEKGLAELNISRSEAEIHVISEGKKGLFGFGKQDAIVEVTAKNELSLSEITEQLEEEQKVKSDTTETPVEAEPMVVEVDEEIKITEVKEQPKEKVAPKSEVVEAKVVEKTVVEEPLKEEMKESQPKPTIEAKEEANVEAVTETKSDEDDQQETITIEEASQKVAVYIQEVIQSYGAQADVEFEISRSQVMFNIETDKSGLVIGKHGKIINSLQILSQTYFQSLYRRRTSILLNVGDYRDRRANVLRQIAQRTADEVLETKQTVILDPLPAYERKQIHAHLARIDRIKTHSEGKEPNRYLVVEYK
ncbi:RNA-binding cell elongation regulator Jag/EloR [Ruoffia tabacinasalis]|jgi:spoIIIJ-associated protein|uniref:RNA-binding protein KhpB n=1 Tax=Ruoffia tabacinasalis TaxID=87458 RepID=A0ABS0LKH4_9LACT|nr:RNA-binding cell elongation regulator Jag/EloR [Ruoffia tabacinasalis]MBG9977954.1 Jag N-terminal domain-containing protein [Ruoffia tabacinasalis]